jgi:transcriptional regulator with XRE-family HTH domain
MENQTPSLLGLLLQERRQELGLSFAELARQANVDRTVIFRIEDGSIRQPDPRKLARLARVLDLPLTRLYTLAGYPTGGQLPSFQPYLRHRYRALPPEAVDKLADYFNQISQQYGTDDGPDDGEDERPDQRSVA